MESLKNNFFDDIFRKKAILRILMLQWIYVVIGSVLFFSEVYSTQTEPVERASPTVLQVIEKKLNVNGKEAAIFAIEQKDGTLGLSANKGQMFHVKLENKLQDPTSVHWHGLILPNNQDGVAFVTQYPIYPGLSYTYHFPILQSGTFWMHSHVGLQEQRLLTAPLIFYDADDKEIADQEAVIFLSDFSFQSPEEIFRELRCRKKNDRMSMSDDKMEAHDIVDVKYDAFLANHRTLESPEVIEVKPGDKVRLRVINGASATNFFLHLGDLIGEVIAVDGNRTHPLPGSQFELAIAQRIDILVKIPQQGGTFPILAQGEGTDMQTGIILVTKHATPPKVSSKAVKTLGRISNDLESQLRALSPLPAKQVDNRIFIELGGDMESYTWTLNGKSWPEVTPPIVEKGQRVEIVFKNSSQMSHPMHLHGHVFQVTAIDGKKIEGAMRDTVLVMPRSTLAIQFDADNPGVWPLHCHVLYHMEAGMFTVLRYKGFIQPL
jgi:FtsP/CotA-like multicopper oxidase with cupredoxin domain